METIDEEVDGFLEAIEEKYVKTKAITGSEFHNQLSILSEEFSTLGLPPFNINQPPSKLLLSVMNNTFLLIQLHRKTLLAMRNVNISNKSKDTQTDDLQKKYLKLKSQLKEVQDQNLCLERKIFKLNSDNEELTKRLSLHTKNTDRLKQFFKSKQDQLVHRISSLDQENHHLKVMCGKDFDKYFSKEDKFLKILKTYKNNEKMYKEALQKLEENNVGIMNEILNLKSELALAYK